MGMFVGISGIVGRSEATVAAALKKFAAITRETQDDDRCLIVQEGANTSILYPSGFIGWADGSAYLSRELDTPVFAFHIHDSDLWMYTLYINGKPADDFVPIPDYWDENISREHIRSMRGNANKVAAAVPGVRAASIEKYLVHWDTDVEAEVRAYEDDKYPQGEWQLLDFMRKLGMPFPDTENELHRKKGFHMWGNEAETKPEKVKRPWWKFWG